MSRNVWLVSSRLAVRNGLPLAEQVVQRRRRRSTPTAARARRCGFRARAAAVPAAARGPGRRLHLVEDQRSVLALLGRLALYVDELRACVTGSNTITNCAGSCTEIMRLFAGGQFDRIDGDLSIISSKPRFRKIDAGAPEHLAVVFPDRQRMRIVRRDPAHARVDGEGDLDHLVEGRLVAGRAEGAVVVPLLHRLERRAGVEHAAAARAQHVPRQLEDAQARGVQERRDRLLLVEPVRRRSRGR